MRGINIPPMGFYIEGNSWSERGAYTTSDFMVSCNIGLASYGGFWMIDEKEIRLAVEASKPHSTKWLLKKYR